MKLSFCAVMWLSVVFCLRANAEAENTHAETHSRLPPRNIGNLTYLGQTRAKFYYKSSNSAYYEQAQQDCINLLEGRLIQIESSFELQKLKRLIAESEDNITKVWVGAKPKDSCNTPRPFDPDCWTWDKAPTAMDLTIISWSSNANNNLQLPLSRGILVAYSGELYLNDNTVSNRYLCEMQY